MAGFISPVAISKLLLTLCLSAFIQAQQLGYFSNMSEKYTERGIGSQSSFLQDGNESIGDYDGNLSIAFMLIQFTTPPKPAPVWP